MGFILKSLAISVIAIFVWSLFNEYQINENYFNIPLTEQEAKQKAESLNLAKEIFMQNLEHDMRTPITNIIILNLIIIYIFYIFF